MTAFPVGSRERTLLFVTSPALWPHWPFLPLVRRTGSREELGALFDARVTGQTGFATTVLLCNMFLLPASFAEFLALPREAFNSAEELTDAGWRVD